MAINLPTQVFLKGIESTEKFTGSEEQDPVTWLQTMTELFDGMKVTDGDRRNLLPLYFSEDVKKWYRGERLSEKYNEFQMQFVEAFTSSTHQLKILTKLLNRRQGNNESIQSYYYDIMALCSRVNPEMPETEQLIHLLRGLKPSIQQYAIMNNPQKCKDLFEQAKRIEAAAAITQITSNVTVNMQNDEIEETTAALRRTFINRNPNRNSNNSSDYTYNKDNKWRDRTSRYQSSQRRERQCYNCYGYGHLAYQCPSYFN